MINEHELATERNKFKRKTGYDLNIDTPRSFNEKLCWKKLHDRNPLIPLTSDKVKVQDYIKAQLGTDRYLVPMYWHGDNPDDIPFDSLPEKFILKANNACNRTIIVNGAYSTDGIKQRCRRWLKTPYPGIEWGYKPLHPQILIEKYLEGELRNIKLYMLHGKCRLIQTETHVFKGKPKPDKFLTVYNPNWTMAEVQRCGHELDDMIDKPDCFDEMVSVAEKLSVPFDFVRVDFMLHGNDLYVGELTHYPGAGRIQWENQDFDFEFGKKYRLIREYWKTDDRWSHLLQRPEPAVFNIIPGREPLLIMTWYWLQAGAWAKYSPAHVNRWFRQMRDNLTISVRFACVTDFPEGIDDEIQIIPELKEFLDVKTTAWAGRHPRCYRRLPLFHPDAEKIFSAKRYASMDLDMQVIKNLDAVFDRDDDFIITASSGKLESNPYNGSMLMMNAGARPKVYTRFTPELAQIASGSKAEVLQNGMKFIGSDQSWIAWALGGLENVWTDDDGVYRWHVSTYRKAGGQIPENCKIMFMPGAGKKMDGEIHNDISDLVSVNGSAPKPAPPAVKKKPRKRRRPRA